MDTPYVISMGLQCEKQHGLPQAAFKSVTVPVGKRSHRFCVYIGRSGFFEKTVKAVENQFTLKQVNLDDIDSYAKGVHFKTTKVLTLEELEEAKAGTTKNSEIIANA